MYVYTSRLNDLVKGFFIDFACSAVKNDMAKTVEWKSLLFRLLKDTNIGHGGGDVV